MMKFFDIPGDLGFTKFFRDFSIRKIKMGTMVGLLNQLGMKESKAELIKVINSFIVSSVSASSAFSPTLVDDIAHWRIQVTTTRRMRDSIHNE